MTATTFPELLPQVMSLSRREKFRLIQLLADDLAVHEDGPQLQPGAEYPVWSPLHAHEAAEQLRGLLEAQRNAP